MIIGLFTVLAIVSASVLPASAGRWIKDIQKRGELWVGTAGSMPPLNMTTKDGKVIGLEVDVARYMAGAMGVKLKLKTMPFSELLPALQDRKVDMILSGMTITPRRNLKVAFVGPYMISGKAFLTKEKAIAAAKEGAEINRPNVTLAALKGSTSQYFVERVIPKAKLVTTKDYDEAVKMVLDDKVDALVADFPICVISVFRFPGRGLVSVITPLTYEPLGIALHPDDTHLVNWVENFLNALEGSGEMDALKERWFGNASWLQRLP
jgi:polar amino acid transport system substrate-binding protein